MKCRKARGESGEKLNLGSKLSSEPNAAPGRRVASGRQLLVSGSFAYPRKPPFVRSHSVAFYIPPRKLTSRPCFAILQPLSLRPPSNEFACLAHDPLPFFPLLSTTLHLSNHSDSSVRFYFASVDGLCWGTAAGAERGSQADGFSMGAGQQGQRAARGSSRAGTG